VLTAEDITNRKFEKAAFGYKAEEVEIFLKDVALAVSKLEEEKDEAEEKLEVLAEKLEEYRSNEDSLRTVLIGAQKLGDSIIRDSKGKAEVILSEAEANAKQIYYESERKIKKEKEALEQLQKETSDFKKHLLSIYRQHLELITAMPEVQEEKAAPPVPAEEPAPEEPPEEIAEELPEEEYDEVSIAETKKIEIPVQE